jgi:hypothetical protein
MESSLPGRRVEAKNAHFVMISKDDPRTETSTLQAGQMENIGSVKQERDTRKELAVNQTEGAIIYDPSADTCH